MNGEKNVEKMPSAALLSSDVEPFHGVAEPATPEPPISNAPSPLLSEQNKYAVAQQNFRAMFSWEAYGRALPHPPPAGRKRLVPIVLVIMMSLIISISIGLTYIPNSPGYKENVDVTGRFTIEGQPMRGTVSIPEEGLRVDTDNLGMFVLEDVPAGLHTFHFQSGSGEEYTKEVFISKYASTEVNLYAGAETLEMPEFTRSFEDLDARYYGTALALAIIALLGAFALKNLDRMPSLSMGASAASLAVLFLAYGSEAVLDLLSFILLGISAFCLALTIPLVARRRLNNLTDYDRV